MQSGLGSDVLMFGEEDVVQTGKFAHPVAVLFHFLFRVGAVVTYLLCTWFSESYITNFVLVLTLLSFDFWTVKNITGRLLVGLRWWNYVDDEGKSHWVYERRKIAQKVSSKEVKLFWAGLVLLPIVWFLLVLVAIFTFKLKWLLVAVCGITLSSANLYGYLMCKLGSISNVKTAAQSFLGRQMIANLFSRTSASGDPSTNSASSTQTV